MSCIKNNSKLNSNYKKIDSYVEAIEGESVDMIKKLTTNVIKGDIVLEIYKNNLLTVKRLKFIQKKCMNYLYISTSLIKRLMSSNDIELLKIIFNSINFFDNDFIKIIMSKNKKIYKYEYFPLLLNYPYSYSYSYSCSYFYFYSY